MKALQVVIYYMVGISASFAQDKEVNTPKNYIAFQTTQILFGEYQLSFERMINKRLSVEFTGSFQPIRNPNQVREPGFNGSLYTDGIFRYESLRWTKFNQSFMIELTSKYYYYRDSNFEAYLSLSAYYRNCIAKNSNWNFMTPKSSDNQYWINADINSSIFGGRGMGGFRFIFGDKDKNKVRLFIEPYTGLGYRNTKGNVFYHKFEEKINPANNKYHFNSRKSYSGLTIHLGLKIGIGFL